MKKSDGNGISKEIKKTKEPSKEFQAQVSDYVPIRRKRPWDIQPSLKVENQVSEVSIDEKSVIKFNSLSTEKRTSISKEESETNNAIQSTISTATELQQKEPRLDIPPEIQNTRPFISKKIPESKDPLLLVETKSINNYSEINQATVTKRSLNGNETELTVTKRSLNDLVNGNETVTRPLEINQATVTKRSLNGNETELTVTKRSLNDLVNGNETVTRPLEINQATVTKRSLNGNELEKYNLLIGIEKKFVDLVFHQCQISASLNTSPINIELIRSYLGPLSDGAIKMAVHRVISKEVITRVERKNGRAGWVKFGMTQILYNHLVFRSTVTEQSRNGNESFRQPSVNSHETVTEQSRNGNANSNEVPSSMYVGINNNTIHTEPPIQPILDEWADLREIDFATLAPWNIKSSVVETFKKNKWLITREQLEDFIERFLRYFTEAEFEARRASIRSPYSLFLNSVKALSQGEPDPICDVKTQFDLQREIAIKNKQKQLEENKRRFDALEKSLDQCRESEFETWLAKLTLEEQSKLVPPKAMAQVGSIAYRQLLKAYYTEMIWPQFKQTILNGPRA